MKSLSEEACVALLGAARSAFKGYRVQESLNPQGRWSSWSTFSVFLTDRGFPRVRFDIYRERRCPYDDPKPPSALRMVLQLEPVPRPFRLDQNPSFVVEYASTVDRVTAALSCVRTRANEFIAHRSKIIPGASIIVDGNRTVVTKIHPKVDNEERVISPVYTADTGKKRFRFTAVRLA